VNYKGNPVLTYNSAAAAAAAAAASSRPLPQVSHLPDLSVDELVNAPSTSQEGAFGAFNMPVRPSLCLSGENSFSLFTRKVQITALNKVYILNQ
jgi:hypothetical protein